MIYKYKTLVINWILINPSNEKQKYLLKGIT